LIRKLLVANRGEIAVRVIQAAQEMGIATAAVYSDPDCNALHVRLADEAYPLGGSTPLETYLDIGKIVGIAGACAADAVHPGYGFLSEREAFAAAVRAAGMVFIGPPPGVLDAVGDKLEARRRMQAAGVPTVPGLELATADAPKVVEELARLGIPFPIMVKAVAGGGGKGMRRVDSPEALPTALESAAREAEKAFGDGRLYLEQLLERPRQSSPRTSTGCPVSPPARSARSPIPPGSLPRQRSERRGLSHSPILPFPLISRRNRIRKASMRPKVPRVRSLVFPESVLVGAH